MSPSSRPPAHHHRPTHQPNATPCPATSAPPPGRPRPRPTTSQLARARRLTSRPAPPPRAARPPATSAPDPNTRQIPARPRQPPSQLPPTDPPAPALTDRPPPPPAHPVPPASNPCPPRQVETIPFPPTRSARGGPDAGRSPYGAARRPHAPRSGESPHRPPPAGQDRRRHRRSTCTRTRVAATSWQLLATAAYGNRVQ